MSIDHDDGEGQPPRPRRNTLECFNAELAVLDRPLESDIEYYDEPPRRSRRWLGTVVGLVGMLGSFAAFALTRRPNIATSDVNAGADGARPRVAVVTPSPRPHRRWGATPSRPRPVRRSSPRRRAPPADEREGRTSRAIVRWLQRGLWASAAVAPNLGQLGTGGRRAGAAGEVAATPAPTAPRQPSSLTAAGLAPGGDVSVDRDYSSTPSKK